MSANPRTVAHVRAFILDHMVENEGILCRDEIANGLAPLGIRSGIRDAVEEILSEDLFVIGEAPSGNWTVRRRSTADIAVLRIAHRLSQFEVQVDRSLDTYLRTAIRNLLSDRGLDSAIDELESAGRIAQAIDELREMRDDSGKRLNERGPTLQFQGIPTDRLLAGATLQSSSDRPQDRDLTLHLNAQPLQLEDEWRFLDVSIEGLGGANPSVSIEAHRHDGTATYRFDLSVDPRAPSTLDADDAKEVSAKDWPTFVDRSHPEASERGGPKDLGRSFGETVRRQDAFRASTGSPFGIHEDSSLDVLRGQIESAEHALSRRIGQAAARGEKVDPTVTDVLLALNSWSENLPRIGGRS